MDRPLISFFIWCYNQEQFIREAVEGAFSQDYAPLEIVISDDCSKDRTFEIVQQLACAYRGPHRVVLNRNPQNLGIGGNVSRTMGLCHGELLVMAGGDDVSLPGRTSMIVEAWNRSGRQATSLYSRFTVIDEAGRPRDWLLAPYALKDGTLFLNQQVNPRRFARRRRPAFCGCAHAVSPKLHSLFDALPARICYEDVALAFRTALLGGHFMFINAPLVNYRWHGANTTFGLEQSMPKTAASFQELLEKRRCELDRFVVLYQSFAADAARAKQLGLISPADYSHLERRIAIEQRRFQLRSDMLGRSWGRRLAIFWELYRNTFRPRELMHHLPLLLPRSVYCAATIARSRLTGS
jgi:glycosyltransferase involved in cell wall biosynthesis